MEDKGESADDDLNSREENLSPARLHQNDLAGHVRRAGQMLPLEPL